MPLRDHFHPPLSEYFPWDGVHGGWPMLIAMDLNKRLPARYRAAPNIHIGTAFEIDISASEQEESGQFAAEGLESNGGNGGVATAIWAPPTDARSRHGLARAGRIRGARF